MSTTQKVVKGFGSYTARRAPAYNKGKSGYDEGFLPARTSPIRFAKPGPSVAKTAREPKAIDAVEESLTELASWKRDLTRTRRTYMADHISRAIQEQPIRRNKIQEAASRGREKREALLNAPESEAELMALPSIEKSIADEYPLRDDNRAARERKRTQNRIRAERIKEEDRLHQFLTIHHNSSNYATTLEGLESMLEKTIGAATQFDIAPKHRLDDLVGQPGTGSYLFSKTNQLERAIEDQLLGTAASGKPGITEISHILKENQDQVKDEKPVQP